MALRLDLENNPDFLADLLDDSLTRDVICEKWNASAGYVSDRRRKARAGKTIASVDFDAIEKAAALPSETTEITEDESGKTFSFIRHRPVTLEDARDLIRSSGDDPELYNIAIKTIAYGGDKSSNKISAWPKTGMALVKAAPLSHLYALAESLGPVSHPAHGENSTVIVLADWQIGKTGRRGGTPELLQRLADARAQLDNELALRRPASILILDGGDGIEGFESGGNPMFTNDLSLPDQLDCYATELLKFIRLAAQYAPVEVGVVSSNHPAWRRGKQNLGNPSDDFGIHVHKQVAKVAEAAGLDATWHLPDEYDESLCVDFAGTAIGLVHGNQFGPGKAIDWWTAQAFGNQACARADVLVTCHYHTWGAGTAGINPFSQRERVWLGAPTLDSGSDWYRNIKGRDSLPGTMLFDVTEAGFNLGSLKVV